MDDSCSSNENSESEAKLEAISMKKNENNLKNISPFMSKDLIAAAGFNVETPIVNAIIGNLTGTLPTKKSETEMVKCEICHIELSSNIVLNFHINGSKHKKRLKALEIIAQLKSGKHKVVHSGGNENPNAFRCEICSLSLNSPQQLEIHLSGAKHKRKAAKANSSEPVESNKNSETTEKSDNSSPSAAKKKKKDEPTLIPCDICKVFMNSQTQYDQHLLSKKHLSKTTGIQENRRILGKGKFIKFPEFRSGGTQFLINASSQSYEKDSKPFNPQFYNRLPPYSNFVMKNPLYNSCRNGVNNLNSFRQSTFSRFQNRF